MADRWMDERDRNWRDRDWRRSEDAGRGSPYGGEERSFDGDSGQGARRSGADRDRVFGENDTGAGYNRPQPGGGGYRAGGSYGGGESYGRGAGGGRPGGQMGGQGNPRFQSQDYRETSAHEGGREEHAHGRGWQGRDYQGVSPAMAHEEYDVDRGPGMTGGGRNNPRFGAQDYTQGGRFYGDDSRQPIYREEYGQGGREYGPEPRGYDAGRGQGGRSGGQYGGSYGGAGGSYGYGNARPAYGGTASGGTGGYDFERGYGDGGRRDFRGAGWDNNRRGDETGPADFIARAGEKVKNWIRGDHLMRDSGHDEPRSYTTDFGRERRYMPDHDHRGMGPKGYKRSNERITEEVHERLTEDSWLDASNIEVRVEDGEVTLTGTVDNRESKHRAERLVEDVPGISHVQNNLRVMSNPLTGSGHGFGDHQAEQQMRRDDPTANGSGGAAGTTPGTNGTEDSASTRTTTRRT